MKTKILMSLILSIASAAQASFFADDVDTVESADVLARCSQASELVSDGKWIGAVSGQYSQVSEQVSKKVYTYSSFQRDGFVGGRLAATLTVTKTLVQPAPEVMDAPATASYSCALELLGQKKEVVMTTFCTADINQWGHSSACSCAEEEATYNEQTGYCEK